MAPSQRGLGVTMKRGRKGVTARPNGAGVHINIEHVDVISCERRQLASEVPMRKVVGLVEAPPGSPWLKALDSVDCKQFMNLLQVNPCQVVQKSKAGFTVVHAAAMRGCLKLLDQVFDLLEDNDRFVDEEEGIEVSLQELLKAETNLESWEFAEKARLTAFELGLRVYVPRAVTCHSLGIASLILSQKLYNGSAKCSMIPLIQKTT